MNSDCIQLVGKWTVTKVSICIHYVYGACSLSRRLRSQVHKQGIKSYRLLCVWVCEWDSQKKGANKSISQSFSLGAFPTPPPPPSSFKLKIIFTFYFIFMFAPRKFFLPLLCFSHCWTPAATPSSRIIRRCFAATALLLAISQ